MSPRRAQWFRAVLCRLPVRLAGASLALGLLVPVLAPLSARCACGMECG